MQQLNWRRQSAVSQTSAMRHYVTCVYVLMKQAAHLPPAGHEINQKQLRIAFDLQGPNKAAASSNSNVVDSDVGMVHLCR
jgi:hypothetical protein